MAAEARGLLAGEIPSFEDLPRLSYTEKVRKSPCGFTLRAGT